MRIRTITVGANIRMCSMDDQIDTLSHSLKTLSETITEKRGFEVQTLRLTTQPFAAYSIRKDPDDTLSMIKDIESNARRHGFDFISVGRADIPEDIKLIPRILSDTNYVSASSLIADFHRGPMDINIDASVEAVKEISTISRDGSRNFMFASIANCPPDIPFFPASYHVSRSPCLSIGLESGDMAYEAAKRTRTLKEAGNLLAHLYEKNLKPVEKLSKKVRELNYCGIDLSLNPGLDEGSSMAEAVQIITGSPFGSQGTLAGCASFTGALKNVRLKSCGYSGLMLPVLEDRGLAHCAGIGSINLHKLLLYSSVCGTGIDAVPLPGDAPETRLASTIRDLAYQSWRLQKPLSARLLPIPGKGAGDVTDLGSSYLVDCPVMGLI